MKALATIGVGPMGPVLDLALASFRPYAERHGYEMIVGSGESAGRPVSWGKILLMRSLIESYDEVLWLDSDMVIVKDDVDLASVVPDNAFQAIAHHRESNGELAPNAGLWFVRAGPSANDFLTRVWNDPDDDGGGMWDNRALLELLGYTTTKPYRRAGPSAWDEGTYYLSDEWNYPVYEVRSPPYCRILHYCAMPNPKRLRMMKLALLGLDRPRPPARRFLDAAETGLRRIELSWYARRQAPADRKTYSRERFGG